jgi:dipicolinate synthase subunit A
MGNKKFALVGGDFRNQSLIRLFVERGYEVKTFALGEMDCGTMEMALVDADVVIGPIPFSNDGKTLNTPLYKDRILLSEFFKCISSKAILIGAKIDKSIQDYAKIFHVKYVDILKREDFAILNAIPTAEGAIEIAISETFVTLNGENVLVFGYGRIGKILGQMLKGLGSQVRVVSRNSSEKAFAKGFGIKTIDYKEIKEHLEKAKVVFNTVPSKVIDKECLKWVPKDALIIDLSSKPGGVDFEEARKIGIRTVWALSLPGKTAPETSAEIISDTVFNILKEMGEMV